MLATQEMALGSKVSTSPKVLPLYLVIGQGCSWPVEAAPPGWVLPPCRPVLPVWRWAFRWSVPPGSFGSNPLPPRRTVGRNPRCAGQRPRQPSAPTPWGKPRDGPGQAPGRRWLPPGSTPDRPCSWDRPGPSLQNNPWRASPPRRCGPPGTSAGTRPSGSSQEGACGLPRCSCPYTPPRKQRGRSPPPG